MAHPIAHHLPGVVDAPGDATGGGRAAELDDAAPAPFGGVEDRVIDNARSHSLPGLVDGGGKALPATRQGAEVSGSTPEQLAAYVASEHAKWAKVVAASGAKLD